MANKQFGAGIVLDGEKEFKQAVASINTDIKVLSSEMKKVTSAFEGNADSIEALTAKQSVYEKQIDTQKTKIQGLESALQNAKTEYGENSDQVKRWQIQLNNAEADLSKTENLLAETKQKLNSFGDGMDSASADVKQFGNSADTAADKTLKMGDVIKANLISAAVINGIKRLASAIKEVVLNAAQGADDITTLSKQLSISTESVQEFQYAADLIDVSVEDLSKGLSKTTKAIGAATSANQDYISVADGVNVSIKDQNGNLLSSEEVFYSVIDAIGGMSSETEKNIAAQEIFGKSYQDLLPLIDGGSDALKQYSDQAKSMGLILDTDALNSLNGLQDSFDTFKATAKQAGMAIISEVAPQITAALQNIDVQSIIDSVTNFVNWIFENKDGILITLGLIGGGFAVFNIAKTILGVVETFKAFKDILMASELAQKLLNIAQAAMPIMLIVTGIALLISYLVNLWNTNEEFRNKVIEIWGAVKDWIVDKAQAIASFFTETIPNAFNTAVEWIKNLPQMIWDAIIGAVSRVAEWGINLKDKAIEAAKNLVGGIIETVKELPGQMVEIGKNLVTGLWNGITNAADWLWDKIKGLFKSLTNKIKDFFGIASPSKLMADEVGKFLPEGIGAGFSKQMPGLISDINGQMSALTNDITANVSGIGASNNTYSATGLFSGAIINIRNDNDISLLAKAVSAEMYNMQIQGAR